MEPRDSSGEPSAVRSVLHFNFHDMMGISLRKGEFPYLEMKWSEWRSDSLSTDIALARGIPSRGRYIRVGTNEFYGDGGFLLRNNGGWFEVSSSAIRCEGDVDEQRLEYEIVFPCINKVIVPRGAFLTYSASLVYKGRVILLPSFTSSGKTAILLELLERGAAYIGDNDCFLNRAGDCMLYSPLVGVRAHHLRHNPGLRSKCFDSPLEESNFRLKARMAGLMTRLVGEGKGSSGKGRRPRPGPVFERQLDVRKLFPGVEVVRSARLSHSFILSPGETSFGLQRSDPKDTALTIAMKVWLGRNDSRKMLSDLAGIPHFSLEESQRVVEDGLANVDCHRLWFDRITCKDDVVKLVDLIEQRIT